MSSFQCCPGSPPVFRSGVSSETQPDKCVGCGLAVLDAVPGPANLVEQPGANARVGGGALVLWADRPEVAPNDGRDAEGKLKGRRGAVAARIKDAAAPGDAVCDLARAHGLAWTVPAIDNHARGGNGETGPEMNQPA